jgi:hypothetical protein
MMHIQDMDKNKSPKQRTAKGHEILVPEREDVLRDLKKAAKVKPSTPRRPKK